ncbi:MAG: type III-A CRISPR-associated RAMP protein Csm3 [Lachnospiraceae bacterium]|nr:type III-A CRISPR-associated RAMP protein Csm3 [Lachnospiraceae bacterium]
MYAKIQITGIIEVVTGMHIGGSSAFAAIGAVDSPVIKDVRTGYPMIPGSSLKGKMRTLLAKVYNEHPVKTPDDDCEKLTRLFGSAKKNNVKASRIIISDMMLKNNEELRAHGLQAVTEVKFENTINRITAVANPRQIERAVRGSKFGLDFIYEVDKEDEIIEDFEVLTQGMRLMQYDYLGGNGSRGYGKIKFSELSADIVIGDISDEIMSTCNQLLEGV